MAKGTVRGISVTTRCETIADFVDHYADRADEDSIFVAAALHASLRMIDRECAFAFLLADEKPVLAGTCVIRDIHADSSNPFRCQGLRLRIVRMGPASEKVFTEMRRVRIERARSFIECSDGIPVPALDEVTTQPVGIRVKRRSRGRLVVAVAVAAVVAITFLQSRPSTATVRPPAPAWLGVPMSAWGTTKPTEHAASICK
jgi:hypothetical protein